MKNPRLVPSADSPRLQPRTGAPIRSGAVGRVSSSYGNHAYGNGWHSWCDPYHYGYYHGCHSYWSLYGGCWSWSLWYPWVSYSSYYWNHCYSGWWWNNWAYPYYASSSYWWYPSTTYCPTYLYVPGGSVVVEEAAPGESVAAGSGGVPSSAGDPGEPREVRGDVAPENLAKKYVELGDYYFKAGRFPEAVEAYGKARSYAPDDASVHFVMADAVFATGDYHFAAFLIAEGLRLDPGLATAETDKRLSYGDPKVFDEQMAALDRYLDIKLYDAQAHLVRGYNLRFSGKSDAAITTFRRVLEIAPENRAAQVFLDALAPKAEAPKAPEGSPGR
ncbi:MAG TPA: tetratricopeptide repeat protein [Planctomycetota bacterium]